MSEQTNNPYCIFITCGDVPMTIGKTGQYVRKFKNQFTNKIDALKYVDAHGYDRITTVRQVNRQNRQTDTCLYFFCFNSEQMFLTNSL